MRNYAYKDLSGMQFGRLKVLHRSRRQDGIAVWVCKCSCGNETAVVPHSLTNGYTKSCGCFRKDRMSVSHEYEIVDDVVYLKLKKGTVMIDKEDLPKVRNEWWHITKNGYAISNQEKKLMHRLIIDAKPGELVDHINRNRLDNRKINLRIASPSVNSYNSTRKPGVTGEKYITFSRGYYLVTIGRKYCGCSKSLEEAVRIRNNAFESSEAKIAGATINYI